MKKTKLFILISIVLILVISISMSVYAYIPMRICTDDFRYYWKWTWEGSYTYDSQTLVYKTIPYNPNAACYKRTTIIYWSDGFLKDWKRVQDHYVWYDRVTGQILSP